MERLRHLSLIRAMGIILMFLWSLDTEAQIMTNPVLTWDQEVGCIKYDDHIESLPPSELYPPGKNVNLLEEIMDGPCVRFCEGTVVNYALDVDDVMYVEWSATGGTIVSSSNTEAEVEWGVNGNGSLTLTLVYDDNTVQVRTVCIEKIVKPTAYYEINGSNPTQTLFNVGSSISFKNLSNKNNGTPIVNYLWDFGDGNFSTLPQPVHQYTESGTFDVVLTVINSCNCTDTYYSTFSIEDPGGPGGTLLEITCANITCEGETEFYTVNDPCPSGGSWHVTGGQIVGGGSGTTSVSVLWNQVNPHDGFGYVSYQSSCGGASVTVDIPVILRSATISGPAIICQGRQELFALPQWPTTDFEWRINGNPNHPMLVLTDQRNEVMVDGLTPGHYTLSAHYHNTLLLNDRCKGIANFNFQVVETPVIHTADPLTFCAGVQKTFHSNISGPVHWEITLGGTIEHAQTSVLLNYKFDKGGTYVVTATHNGCKSDPIVLYVIPQPVITGAISGPAKVCLNVPYTYTISENEPGAIYVWTATGGGTVIGTNAGTEVDVIFTGSVGTVSVVKQYVKNGVICTSTPVNYSVSQLTLNPVIVNNSGLTQFCPSSTYTFTVDLNGVVADHIEWELSPDNFGNIVSGVNDNTVSVALNEVSGTTTGTLKVTAIKCATQVSATHTVNLIPKIEITIGDIDKDPICPNDDFWAEITSNVPNGTQLEVKYSNNPAASATITYNPATTNYLIPQLFNSDTDAVGAVLSVRPIDPYNCPTTVTAYKNVTILPKTTVELYRMSSSNKICITSGYVDDIELKATVYTGVTADADYKWYHDDGTNITHFTTTSAPELILNTTNFPPLGEGAYYVEVTDVNGCVITSNEIQLYGCSTGGGNEGEGGEDEDDHDCNISFTPLPVLNYNWVSCDEVEITASGAPVPLSYIWSITGAGNSVQSGATYNLAKFTVPHVGVFNVRLQLTYSDCTYTFSKNIKVVKNYEPILRYAVTCGANGNYTIELKNNTKLFEATLPSIQYLNSAGTPVGSGASHTITGVTAGTYTYRMRLGTSPVCETSVQITIAPPPNTTVTVPGANSEYCAEEPILLTIPGGYNSNYRYEWHFLNTHYVASSTNSYINITDQGSKPIRLRIIDRNGCEFESPQIPVTINKAVFNGSINPPNPADFCEPDALPLEFELTNPFDPAPTDIIWMRDNQQVGTGATYLPTQSGSYWAVLVDAKGCKYFELVKDPTLYTLRKPPFASVNGNTSLCFGESTTLRGIYTDPAVQHRWTLNGNPMPGALGSWTTGAANLTVTHNGTTAGTYTYAFETRRPGDTTCIGSYEAAVTVHPPVAAPVVNTYVITCYPYYEVGLSVSAPGAGTYTWSNGATGTSTSTWYGGVHSVTYTTPEGCSATSTVDVPRSPERVLWVVPKGCYDICASTGAYLLGPYGTYQQYRWEQNGAPVQTGAGVVLPQPVIPGGFYQLRIDLLGCWYGSARPEINILACRPAPNNERTERIPATLALSPNPATETVTAVYDTGSEYLNAQSVTVHDVTGVQRLKQSVSGTQGEVLLYISHLVPGTYLVNLQADGVNIAQQKLIRK